MRHTFALISSLAFAAASTAQDWPAFRGPAGDGIAPAQQVPVSWDRETNIKWKVALPQPANGSPIISGGRVFLAAAEDEEGRQRSLYCFDRETGEQLWVRTVAFDKVMPTHASNPYCGSTPAADGKRVVVWHASAGLYCYDFAGEELWRRDFGEFRHGWGYGTSPVLHEGKVILNSGPGARSFVTALDLRDGATIWQVDEPPAPPAEAGKRRLHGSWCTPLVATVGEQEQVICAQPTRVVAYGPEDGRVLWWCEGLSCKRGDLTYSSPVLAGDICIVRAGYEGPEIGIRLGGSGDVTETHRLWHHPGRPSNVGSGVVVDGHAYVPDMAGFVACIEIATGKRLWTERLDRGQLWGSIVYAAGRLYAMNQRGTTVVFEPDPEKLTVVATNPLDERTNATPAISDGEIFLRTHQHLYCIGNAE